MNAKRQTSVGQTVMAPADKPASEEDCGAPDNDDCTWAMIAHLSTFVPLAGFLLGPLVIWLYWRHTSAFVASQAKEALNFNLTVGLAALVCAALILLGIGVPLLVALFVAWLVLSIVAAVKASEGIDYRHPVSLRLVR
jgi:uncharacterized Tic20 family protein